MSRRDVAIVLAVVLAHAALLRPSRRAGVPFATRGTFVEVAPVAAPERSAPSGPNLPSKVNEASNAIPSAPVEGSESTAAPTFGDITAADLVRWGNEPPAYPEPSRQAGEEGTVVVVVNVAPDGAARTVRLGESSGHEALDRAVLESAKQWKFPSKDGAYRVRVEFALQ